MAIIIEFAAFRLDTVNQCLWRRRDSEDDERVLLPPKPFALLRYLAEHAGRLVTEQELVKALWPRTCVQPGSLKSQVHEVRKVLEDNPKAPVYIETLSRRGYRFIAPIREATLGNVSTSKSSHHRLVGRDAMLAMLRDRLQAASRGQRQIVFISGEPGIGKSALVDEFQRQVMFELPGLRIAHGQCIEGYGGTEAYYPMLEALEHLCRSSTAASVVETLAAQAPTWLVQFPALVKREHRETLQEEIRCATRERMVREIGAALEAVTAELPLLLILEDMQWVDHSTVDVLSALARRRMPARLMLIVTKRPLDGSPSSHPLKALKQDLLMRHLCHELDLGPLTQTQVTEYLCDESPQREVPADMAEWVHRHSGGNPLFMVAVLDHLTQRGLISRAGGWQITVPLEEIDVGVPENPRRVIEAQVERLSAQELRALEAASVAGTEFSPSVSASAIEMHPDDFEEICESLARRQRILRSVGFERVPDGSTVRRYEFLHALYREVLYRRQSSRARVTAHRRIGARLETLFAEELSVVATELAHHFEQSSNWSRAVKYLRLAADTLGKRYGHREAVALLKRALALTSKLPVEQANLAEIAILESLASILLLTLDVGSADAYEALASRAAQCGATDVELRALIEMAALWSNTNAQRCLELLDRALRLNERQSHPATRATVRMQCAYWQIEVGGWSADAAAGYQQTVLEMRALDRKVLAPHLAAYSQVQFMRSEYRQSRRSALDALEGLTAGQKGNPCSSLPQIHAAYALYVDALFLGEWGEALREIETTIAALTKNANDIFAHGLRFWRAWLNAFAMDFTGALAICESAVRALGDAIVPRSRRMYLAVMGTALVGLGRHDRAHQHLSLACDEMDRQRLANDWYTRLLVESALTELSLARGNVQEARAQGERFLGFALATEERTWQAFAWEVRARVALAEGDIRSAQDCIARALSTLDGFELPLAVWRVHATAAALADLTDNTTLAQSHRELSRATILRIADSLQCEDSLRIKFISAPSVARILT